MMLRIVRGFPTRHGLFAMSMINTPNQRAFSTQETPESSSRYTKFMKAMNMIWTLPVNQREADKEKYLTELKADKDKQLDKLDKQLEELKADKKKQLETCDKQLARLENDRIALITEKDQLKGDLLAMRGKLHATEAMRPLVEILSKMAFPSTSATQSVQLLCANLIQGNQISSGKVVFGNKLVPYAQAWLNQLEESVEEKSVVNELKDLYHELSKDHHYVDMTKTKLSSGLVCAERLPLRAAVALAILEAQRRLAKSTHEDIHYLNENGERLHVLRSGTVV